MNPCPSCGADWRRTELLGEARHGGGYRVLCHVCDHEWDDASASHHERETARHQDRDLEVNLVGWKLFVSAKPGSDKVTLDAVTDDLPLHRMRFIFSAEEAADIAESFRIASGMALLVPGGST